MLDGAETYQAVGFVEREMPRIGAGKAAAGAGRMRPDRAGFALLRCGATRRSGEMGHG